MSGRVKDDTDVSTKEIVERKEELHITRETNILRRRQDTTSLKTITIQREDPRR